MRPLIIFIISACLPTGFCLSQTAYPSTRLYGDTETKLFLTQNYKEIVATTDFGSGAAASFIKDSYEQRYKNEVELLDNGSLLLFSSLQKTMDSLLQRIIEANGIAKKLRVFVTDDLNPNAYATGDGLLFVNIGLIPHFRTLNELTYVLCHEIAHDINKHPEKTVFAVAKLVTSSAFRKEVKQAADSEYRNATKTELVLRSKLASSFRYKQQNELEADANGLDLYLTLGLPKEQAYSALWTLKNIDEQRDYTPFNVESFVKTWFGEKAQLHWTVPEEGSLGAVAYVPPTLPDSLKTHPDITIRVSALMNQATVDTVAHPELTATYSKIARIAEAEILFSWIDYQNYGRAAFMLASMMESKPDQMYTSLLSSVISMLAEARKNRKLGYHLSLESQNFPVVYNQFLHFMHELSYNDFLFLAEKLLQSSRSEGARTEEEKEAMEAADTLLSIARFNHDDALVKINAYISNHPSGLFCAYLTKKKKEIQTLQKK